MSAPLLDNSANFSGDLAHKWITDAGRAPSPDNNQPWRFHAAGSRIDVFHDRARALPSDVNDLFSWIAIGAAIENLVLSASTDGWRGMVEYKPRPFPVTPCGEQIATVRLEPGAAADPLAESIGQRVTNRKLYARTPIPASDLRQLEAVLDDDAVQLHWLTGTKPLKQLARLVRSVDRIRFEHPPFHDEFHKVLRYGAQSARDSGDGLELKTLELPPMAGPLLRWLSPWKRMQRANLVGMSALFANYSAKQVCRCGAAGLLTTSARSDAGYLQAGRNLQRVWLAATRAGLSFQPLGTLPLFLEKLAVQGVQSFQQQHQAVMLSVASAMARLLPSARERTPIMLFRVGYSPPPTARSLRYPIERIIVDESHPH